ncbi:MAG: ABC transporter permease subunit [Chloroflexota bacterium]|nr:ABC transporter permease subunit [Chloroflexota bacterium]
MRRAVLLARREIIEQYSDRGAVIRALVFVGLPIALVVVNRGNGRTGDLTILIFALQAALLPAATAINAAAGSFAAEKEAQTLVPLLATPVRDIDIVAGKLLAVLAPAAALSAVSIIAFDIAASAVHGADRVARVLSPATLYGLFALSVFLILTIGAWVMVVSARVGSQRTAQQIAGFVLAGTIVTLSALGAAILSLAPEIVIGVLVAVVISDLVALELARRLWDREEAVARL